MIEKIKDNMRKRNLKFSSGNSDFFQNSANNKERSENTADAEARQLALETPSAVTYERNKIEEQSSDQDSEGFTLSIQ